MNDIDTGTLQRIGDKFLKELDYINKKRLDLGIDKKKRSVRALTNVIIRHEAWEKIKRDTIDLNMERLNNE